MFGLRLILILAVVGGLIALLVINWEVRSARKTFCFWFKALSHFCVDDRYNRNFDRLCAEVTMAVASDNLTAMFGMESFRMN